MLSHRKPLSSSSPPLLPSSAPSLSSISSFSLNDTDSRGITNKYTHSPTLTSMGSGMNSENSNEMEKLSLLSHSPTHSSASHFTATSSSSPSHRTSSPSSSRFSFPSFSLSTSVPPFFTPIISFFSLYISPFISLLFRLLPPFLLTFLFLWLINFIYFPSGNNSFQFSPPMGKQRGRYVEFPQMKWWNTNYQNYYQQDNANYYPKISLFASNKYSATTTSISSSSSTSSATDMTYSPAVDHSDISLSSFSHFPPSPSSSTLSLSPPFPLDVSTISPHPFPHIPYDGLYIVTAASSLYYDRLINLIGSFHLYSPSHPIIVFDLGLHEKQIHSIQQMDNVIFKKFPFSLYPLHVQNLYNYAWKILMIDVIRRDESLGATAVIVMDSGAELRKPNALSPIKMSLKKDGFWAVAQSNFIGRKTNPLTFEKLHLSPTDFLDIPFMAGGLNAWSFTNHSLFTNVLSPSIECAMDESCISPIGSGRSNHNYDQSVLSALAYKEGFRWEFDREWREWEMFRVNYYPNYYGEVAIALRRWNLPKPFIPFIRQKMRGKMVADGDDNDNNEKNNNKIIALPVNNSAIVPHLYSTSSLQSLIHLRKDWSSTLSLSLSLSSSSLPPPPLLLEQTDGHYLESSSSLVKCLKLHNNVRQKCKDDITQHYVAMSKAKSDDYSSSSSSSSIISFFRRIQSPLVAYQYWNFFAHPVVRGGVIWYVIIIGGMIAFVREVKRREEEEEMRERRMVRREKGNKYEEEESDTVYDYYSQIHSLPLIHNIPTFITHMRVRISRSPTRYLVPFFFFALLFFSYISRSLLYQTEIFNLQYREFPLITSLSAMKFHDVNKPFSRNIVIWKYGENQERERESYHQIFNDNTHGENNHNKNNNNNKEDVVNDIRKNPKDTQNHPHPHQIGNSEDDDDDDDNGRLVATSKKQSQDDTIHIVISVVIDMSSPTWKKDFSNYYKEIITQLNGIQKGNPSSSSSSPSPSTSPPLSFLLICQLMEWNMYPPPSPSFLLSLSSYFTPNTFPLPFSLSSLLTMQWRVHHLSHPNNFPSLIGIHSSLQYQYEDDKDKEKKKEKDKNKEMNDNSGSRVESKYSPIPLSSHLLLSTLHTPLPNLFLSLGISLRSQSLYDGMESLEGVISMGGNTALLGEGLQGFHSLYIGGALSSASFISPSPSSDGTDPISTSGMVNRSKMKPTQSMRMGMSMGISFHPVDHSDCTTHCWIPYITVRSLYIPTVSDSKYTAILPTPISMDNGNINSFLPLSPSFIPTISEISSSPSPSSTPSPLSPFHVEYTFLMLIQSILLSRMIGAAWVINDHHHRYQYINNCKSNYNNGNSDDSVGRNSEVNLRGTDIHAVSLCGVEGVMLWKTAEVIGNKVFAPSRYNNK